MEETADRANEPAAFSTESVLTSSTEETADRVNEPAASSTVTKAPDLHRQEL